MSGTSSGISTSQWIKFFTDAGIPASDAANYAIIFTDNRIQKDMLMDLNKEILNDMGVKMMGDVIGILRHAKSVHSQEQIDKVLKPQSKTPATKSNNGSSRRSTPASRIIDHYIGKDPSASPLNEPVGSKLSRELAARLGPGPADKQSTPPSRKRKITPDDEGSSDSGSSTSVEVPAAAGKSSSSSVFSRLGEESGDGPQITVTTPQTGIKATTSQGSVFNRLGDAVKRPASSTSTDDEGQLRYAGVLKQTSSSSSPKKPKLTKTTTAPAPGKLKVTITSPVAVTAVSKRISTPGVSAPKWMSTPKLQITKPVSTPKLQITKPVSALKRVSTPAPKRVSTPVTPPKRISTPASAPSRSSNLRMDAHSCKVKDRLGSGKVIATATSTTDGSSPKKVSTNKSSGIKITSRLAPKKPVGILKKPSIKKTVRDEVSSSDDVKSVFSRLGKKT